MANVGGHVSERDTCHVCAAYALLRRWEASPPTLPRMRCAGGNAVPPLRQPASPVEGAKRAPPPRGGWEGLHAAGNAEGRCDSRQDADDELDDKLDGFFLHSG